MFPLRAGHYHQVDGHSLIQTPEESVDFEKIFGLLFEGARYLQEIFSE